MSGDLVSLRMLVVSAFGSAREPWHKGCGLASVPVECIATDGSSAAENLTRGHFDVVVLDATLADRERTVAIAAARKLKPAPYVIQFGGGNAIRDKVDGVFPKPLDAHDALALVERCLRVKLPTRILVVDDSSTTRSIVRKILSASRYNLDISEAEEGIGALNQLSSHSFQVVLLDYNMPGFNGIETLSEIRRVAPGVAVLMMTSTLDAEVEKRAQASGAAAFLKKPFYPADIDAALDRCFAS
jgi:DNA-binding NtrC family response regulator